jgi:hypothetical protein
MYRKTPDGWLLRRVIGGRSVKSVETFVVQGIELDAATKVAQKHKTEAREAPSKQPSKQPASLAVTQ